MNSYNLVRKVVWNSEWVLLGSKIDPDADEPTVTIVLTPKDIEYICVLQGLCQEHDLSSVNSIAWGACLWEDGITIDDGDTFHPDLEELHVSRDRVWWSCYIKHTDIKVRTEMMPLAELVGTCGL